MMFRNFAFYFKNSFEVVVTGTGIGIKYLRRGKDNRPRRACSGLWIIDNDFHDSYNILELIGGIFNFLLPEYWHVLC